MIVEREISLNATICEKISTDAPQQELRNNPTIRIYGARDPSANPTTKPWKASLVNLPS